MVFPQTPKSKETLHTMSIHEAWMIYESKIEICHGCLGPGLTSLGEDLVHVNAMLQTLQQVFLLSQHCFTFISTSAMNMHILHFLQ